ncbi:hypothetical protein GHK92_02685 [Nocardioides sp. dk4132]|uniref:hypothetical protein n=1 Tax=unclassified Nocardioides TaxID=2615069 RepID=UPI00129783C2|nr:MULTISPECIES: hypothetical protein [unclassified Nocardioides]MQW74769.1 hypothetical protein [Nocardioides sp. dk4132]QGA06666.1 hypothetical protein GFH29_04125 [Nocardioides sp. dk884]
MSTRRHLSRVPRLARTLVPTLALLLLAPVVPGGVVGAPAHAATTAAAAAPTASVARAAVPRSGSPGKVRRSWQVDGRVMAVRIKGDLVIVGGEFRHAIAPNGRRVAARNLAVFRLGTGRFVAGAVPGTDGVVRALETRGRWLWVGGYFERVGGLTRTGLAKIDLDTGAVAPGFDAGLDHGVQALALGGGGLLVGGRMTRVGGVAQSWLTRLAPSTGRLDEAFRPQLDGPVFALGVDRVSSRVWTGGAFEHAEGAAHDSVVALDLTTGRVRGRQLARSGGEVLSLQVTSRGKRILLADSFNVLCSWSVRTGARQWRVAAGGNVQAVRVRGRLAYFGVHGGFGGKRRAKLLVADVGTGRVRSWRPGIPDFWGIYAIDASRRGLVAGGRITRVAGVPAGGWVRFLP